jgi:hypothetical protein
MEGSHKYPLPSMVARAFSAAGVDLSSTIVAAIRLSFNNDSGLEGDLACTMRGESNPPQLQWPPPRMKTIWSLLPSFSLTQWAAQLMICQCQIIVLIIGE